MNKRGLSLVITTLILVVLVLVAVAIIWVVVNNILKGGTEGIALGKFTLDAEIKNVNIDNSSNNVSLTVKRNPGKGEISGMKFIFYDGADSEIITEEDMTLKELEQRRFNFHLININVDNLIRISIVPIFKTSSGEETLGNIIDVYEVGGIRECIINCTGKVCGNDGCGGTCSPGCEEGWYCQDGACFEGANPCDLTFASWSETSVVEGTTVTLNVVGTNCAGIDLNYSIYEDDLIGDDFVTSFIVTGLSTTWIAEWIDDGLGGDPEYYFIVRVVGETEEVKSNDPLLSVTQAASCTPATCSGLDYECGSWPNGTCSGTLDCGTCGLHTTCPSGTCFCDSGWGDCNNDNSCDCDLSLNSCVGGSCVVFTGDVYWVSATGTATWANCLSATPLSGASACSLSTANSNAASGDIIYLRGGTYSTHIFPANSGTDINNRITYTNYLMEVPIIRNNATTYATYYHGIALINRNYIKVSGVAIDNPIDDVPGGKSRPLMITHGSSYNEIADCIINGNGGGTITIYDGITVPAGGTPCVHNWIHDSVIANTGSVSTDCNDIGGMQLGVPAYDNNSNYNTFEDNVFYCGGHHNLETFTKYNVIRNNYFHFEGCMAAPNPPCPYGPDTNGLWGNRNLMIYDGYDEDKWNLVEGNRIGHSGPPPDDDGGDGLAIAAQKNIIRYNSIFNSQNNGVLMKWGASSVPHNNRFYQNTMYSSGRYQNSGPQWQGSNFRWYGSYSTIGCVVKNNILYQYGGIGDFMGGSGTIYVDNTVINNWLTSFGNPLFVNPYVSDPTSLTLPDLSLQSTSPAIDNGTYLTTVAISDSGTGTTLQVEDALYFQDGTWGSSLSDIQPDWIAVGTVDNVVQISSIDYSTNIITLSNSISRNDGDYVWLYRDSTGKRVLYGSAPDIGAYEY